MCQIPIDISSKSGKTTSTRSKVKAKKGQLEYSRASRQPKKRLITTLAEMALLSIEIVRGDLNLNVTAPAANETGKQDIAAINQQKKAATPEEAAARCSARWMNSTFRTRPRVYETVN